MNRPRYASMAILGIALAGGCVSSERFRVVRDERDDYRMQLRMCQRQLAETQVLDAAQIADLTARLKRAGDALASQQQALKQAQDQSADAQHAQSDFQQKSDVRQKDLQAQLQAATANLNAAKAKSAEDEKQIEALNDKLTALQQSLDSLTKENVVLKAQLADAVKAVRPTTSQP